MKKTMSTRTYGFLRIATLIFLAAPMIACAEMKARDHDMNQQSTTIPNKPVIQISFDAEGNPVIVDMNGRIIEPESNVYPLKATSIEDIQTISLIRARGSHYYVAVVGNRAYIVPLPH